MCGGSKGGSAAAAPAAQAPAPLPPPKPHGNNPPDTVLKPGETALGGYLPRGLGPREDTSTGGGVGGGSGIGM
jgi:hypothetical protein